jgi:pimeloyl-ACP methyl ester carboxylesterase
VRTSVGRIHLLDVRGRGELPPVVILHGFSAAGAHYFPLIFRLERHVTRIIAPDLPAHGLSEIPRDLAGSTIRDGLFAALDHVIDRPAVVVGNSMGGLAAVHYARSRPDRVRGLVLISPAGATSTSDEVETIRSVFAVPSHRAALDFVDKLFPERNRLRHLYALGVRSKFRRPTMQRLLSALENEMLTPEALADLVMPTLVIWGGADRILPKTHRDFFFRHMPPHTRFEEPKDFGHTPFLDRAEELAARIRRFMRRHVRQ